MNYRLRFTEKANRQLNELPEEFIDPVLDHLKDLAGAPTLLSVPIASPPYPPRGQLYHFELVDPVGDLWFFTVIFRYSIDETALHVLSVTWREIIEH